MAFALKDKLDSATFPYYEIINGTVSSKITLLGSFQVFKFFDFP